MQPVEESFCDNEMGLEIDFFENWLDESKNMVYTHWHDRLEFIYVVEGEGTLTVDLEEYPMEQFFELRSHRYMKSKLLFQGLLTELCRWLCYYGYQDRKLSSQAAGKEVLKLVLSYIREHLNEKLEVTDMARLAGYSKYHFIPFFSEAVGCPCLQYIHMLRIQQAKKLLKDTDMGVNQISEESGFESVSYFIQIFKRSENCTPGRYRKMLLEKRGI